MRWIFFWVFAALPCGLGPVLADDDAPQPDSSTDTIVQEFSGGGPTTTGFFKVQDKWEVRWNAKRVVSVAVMSADGTIVAGAAGVLRGSLFVPLGGQYYLKVTDGTLPPPPPAPEPVVIPAPLSVPSTNGPADATTNAAPTLKTNAASTNAPSAATTNAPSTNAPTTNGAPIANTNAPPVIPLLNEVETPPAPPPEVTWHIQVMQLAPSVAADEQLTVYAPYFTEPDTAVSPVAVPPVLPTPVLTDDEAHTLVTIKGDNAQGTGFLMRSPAGTFVVTHLHLLAGNPNVKLTTSSGAEIAVTGLKGAVDRDLAIFTIQDANYTYLPEMDERTDIEPGDQLIIPDIGAQADILLGKPGGVINASTERIDFDNRLDFGCAGAPVIHVKDGTVAAIVTEQKRVDLSDRIAQAWQGNPAPGSSSIIPYYGLRMTGVAVWETYDVSRFLQESLFLRQFHQNTRYLDSYLNGRRRPRIGDGGENDGPPDSRYFLKSIKLRGAQDTYRQEANGADDNQRLDAARELLFDLQGFAGTDLDTLQGMKGMYAYNQAQAQEEIAYRLALKKELNDLGNSIARLDNLAQQK